ncbi:hypothetical protein [Pseudomonas poae]|uniref:hypothetical protein n=1 Tax=Pseudomonas poae TaxID=200451 RepID=UPI001608BB43|nr:hypothetical protein [Pseudomonas poae]
MGETPATLATSINVMLAPFLGAAIDRSIAGAAVFFAMNISESEAQSKMLLVMHAACRANLPNATTTFTILGFTGSDRNNQLQA